jgi:signal transduction histidine kinase
MAKTSELLEQSLRIQEGISREKWDQPEVLVPKLGESLIRKGLIETGDLKKALSFQQEQRAIGKTVLLGEALLELRLLERGDLDAAVTEQISSLQSALQQSNEMLEQRVAERTEELQHALEGLTEMNRLKANFIANISHELRTPLAHMFGYVDLLAEEGFGSLNVEQKEAIQVLQKSNKRLGSLIDNLLFLSFDSAEAVPLQMEELPISYVIKGVVSDMELRASEIDVHLKADIEPNLPIFLGDGQKLVWALSQIVENAIKFNKPSGKVLIRAQNGSGKINISVLDSGIGIPDEQVASILEPFVQIDGSSTRKYGGTGLGLSLAKRIIEAHGAQLKIESKIDRGSRFSFAIPVSGNIE